MKRAIETSELILKELQPLNELEIQESDLLREGAPIPPEPPVGRWRPEHVRIYICR
jgi:serine/threonine-protein phosphatase PGAM5